MVDMPMQDKGIDALEHRNLPVGVTVRGGLYRLAVGLLRRVKSLFTQNDSAWLPLELHFRLLQIVCQLR